VKSNTKKFIIALIIIIIGSFMISGVILYMTGGITSISVNPYQVATSKEFPVDQVKKIVIKTVNAKVRVIPISAAAKKISADFYGNVSTNISGSRPELETEFKDGVLTVKINYSKTINIGLINIEKLYLDVNVPSDFSGSISMETTSADAEIKNFNLGKLESRSISGNITADNITAGEIVVETTSGKIIINKLSGRLDMNSVSGEMQADLKELTGDINAGSVSGKTEILLPSTSIFIFDLKTVSGSMKNNFGAVLDYADKKNIRGSAGAGKYQIRVETISGSIELVKKQK
jgi:lia operon protein LiaG